MRIDVKKCYISLCENKEMYLLLVGMVIKHKSLGVGKIKEIKDNKIIIFEFWDMKKGFIVIEKPLSYLVSGEIEGVYVENQTRECKLLHSYLI